MKKSKNKTKMLLSRSSFLNGGLLALMAAVVIAAGYIVVHYTLASSCAVTATLVNPCRPWIGAAVGGDPRAAADKISQFAYLEHQIGHPLDIFHDYHPAGSLPLNSDERYYINRTGSYAYVNWKPASNWAAADGSNSTVNASIKQAALNIKSVAPHKIFLTVWHEPENDVSGGTSCAIKPGSAGTPAQYRAMWQNVRTIFDGQHVSNVVWVMNYMGYSKWDCLIPQMWPGNNLVDWVTFDTYGTDGTPTWAGTVGRMYKVLTADSNATTDFTAKPWGAAEFGTCTMTNEQNAYTYYRSVKSAIDTNAYPRLKMYMVYDDTGNNAGPGCLTDSTIKGAYDPTKQKLFNSFADDAVFTSSGTPMPTPASPLPTPTPRCIDICPPSPTPVPVSGGRTWIMAHTALADVAANAAAKAALAHDTIYVDGYNPSNVTAAESGLHMIPTRGYTSEAQLASDIASGSIPSYVKALLYDNEPWSLTPAAEQANAAYYYKLAGQLAHAHGYQLVATPVPNSNAAAVAPYADVVDVQAQSAQASVATYLAKAQAAITGAKAANPRAVVLSGLSTNPPAGDPTVQQLLDIAHATYPSLVRGWWLNIPAPGTACPGCNQPRPDTAIAFLSQLGGTPICIDACRTTPTPTPRCIDMCPTHTPSPTPLPQTLSLVPTSDTFVQEPKPMTNFGNAMRLVASRYWNRALFRFATGRAVPVGDQVNSAKLRLYVAANPAKSGGLDVHLAAGDYCACNVTWKTQPAEDAAAVGTSATPQAGSYVTIDLPRSAVITTGDTNLAVRYTVPDQWVEIASREDASHQPQLILSVGPKQPWIVNAVSSVLYTLTHL